jgi:hypothetical protein
MRKLIAALAMALAATLVYAQNPSILRPRIEIVSASDEDSGPGLEVFYMGDEDPRMYYLSLGHLAVGSEMVQVYIDPLTELFVPLGATVEEALARLEEIKDLFKMPKGQAEDLETLKKSYTDMNEVEFSEAETGEGTKLLVAKETGEDEDFVSFLSVYKGYTVEFVLTPNPAAADQTLTDDQIQKCVNFLTGLQFIPAAGTGEG